MSGIKLEKFGGQLPAWEDSLLPGGQAAIAINSDVLSGALTGWRAPKLLRQLTNSAAAFVYRVPTVTETRASVNLLFLANVNAGDTAKVSEQLYTFTATVTNPYDVLVGATAADSAANLYAAITGGTGAGTLFGLGTVRNADIWITDADDYTQEGNVLSTATIGVTSYPWIRLNAEEVGAAFNAQVVAENTTNTRLTWLSTIVSLGDTTNTFLGGTNPSFDPAITGAGTWMEFLDPDTTVVRSPVVNDQYGRYYISSPSLPPRYNTYDRIVAGSEPWMLGVPAPGCAPIVAVTGGGDSVLLGNSPPVNPLSTASAIYANTIHFVKVRPTAAISLDDISFMPTQTLATAQFAGVCYSDNAGEPYERLCTSAIIEGCESGTQQVLPFVNPIGLLADTDYWIGVFTDTTTTVTDWGTGYLGNSITQTFDNGPPAYADANPTTGLRDIEVWANATSSAVLASRSYVYTWETEYGEEGPPSPFTLVNGWSNGIWTTSLYTPALDDMGVVRNIMYTNIYRTIVGSGGLATYFFVAQVPVNTHTFVDTIEDDVIALNEQLPSITWFEPPEGLQGMISMPNGMIAAFRDNEVWFCEPYRPHAWPPGYVVTTEFPVIGLGITGQTLVVCTAGMPYTLTGVHPSSMASDKGSLPEPCVSRGSIISTDAGVTYVSANGLVQVTQAGQTANMTDIWVTRPRWHELTPPKYLRSILLSSQYFSFSSVFNGDDTYAQEGFAVELSPTDSNSFTIWPQPGGHRVGFTQLTAPGEYDIMNVQVDPWTGIGMLVQNNAVYYYDFTDINPTIQVYRWRSKLFQSKSAENFAAMKVYFDIPGTTPTQNPYRKEDPTDDPSWDTLDADRYGYIRVYANDVLVTVREIRTSGELLRILDGFKAEHWQFEIEARVAITDVQIATSVKQLRQL